MGRRLHFAVLFVLFSRLAAGANPTVAAVGTAGTEPTETPQVVVLDDARMSVDFAVLLTADIKEFGAKLQESGDLCTFDYSCTTGQGCTVVFPGSGVACWDCASVTPVCCEHGASCLLSNDCC